jgi:hypothetical protein
MIIPHPRNHRALTLKLTCLTFVGAWASYCQAERAVLSWVTWVKMAVGLAWRRFLTPNPYNFSEYLTPASLLILRIWENQHHEHLPIIAHFDNQVDIECDTQYLRNTPHNHYCKLWLTYRPSYEAQTLRTWATLGRELSRSVAV